MGVTYLHPKRSDARRHPKTSTPLGVKDDQNQAAAVVLKFIEIRPESGDEKGKRRIAILLNPTGANPFARLQVKYPEARTDRGKCLAAEDPFGQSLTVVLGLLVTKDTGPRKKWRTHGQAMWDTLKKCHLTSSVPIDPRCLLRSRVFTQLPARSLVAEKLRQLFARQVFGRGLLGWLRKPSGLGVI